MQAENRTITFALKKEIEEYFPKKTGIRVLSKSNIIRIILSSYIKLYKAGKIKNKKIVANEKENTTISILVGKKDRENLKTISEKINMPVSHIVINAIYHFSDQIEKIVHAIDDIIIGKHEGKMKYILNYEALSCECKNELQAKHHELLWQKYDHSDNIGWVVATKDLTSKIMHKIIIEIVKKKELKMMEDGNASKELDVI